MHQHRRSFIKSLAAAGVAGAAGMARAQQAAAPKILFGVCVGQDKAAKLKAIGYEFIEGGVEGTLKPNLSDAAFAPDLATLKASALPIRSCNGFIPKQYRLTGPEARHDEALEYAVKACHRADVAGVSYIVFGSGGARNVPAGFDPAKGKDQLVGFCQKLAARIQDCKVTVVLEPLNKGESNILNTVADGITYVDAINSPRIRLLADFYHMLKDGEAPESIRLAGERIRHCHIAELEGRKAPGTKGEDLSGFFKALLDIRYTGGVSCECGWPKERVEDAWQKAFDTMRSQSQP